jgi:hypothetical protein
LIVALLLELLEPVVIGASQLVKLSDRPVLGSGSARGLISSSADTLTGSRYRGEAELPAFVDRGNLIANPA